MSDAVADHINTKYENVLSSSRYSDALIVVIICCIVFAVLVHYLIVVNSRSIVNDWNNRRCDPTIIPFAGIINAPEGKSIFEYTAENFSTCVKQSVSDEASDTIKSFETEISRIMSQIALLSVNASVTRTGISQFRQNTSDTIENVYDKLNHVTISLAGTVSKMKDVLNKTHASIVSGMYTLRGGIITSESVILRVYEQTVTLLWTLHAFIISCGAIGCLYPTTMGVSLAASTFLTALLVPLVSLDIIMGLLGDEFSVSVITPMPNDPSISPLALSLPAQMIADRSTIRKCFDGRTNIATKYEGDIMIKHLTLGQELRDGSIVTALTKSTSTGSALYRLGTTIVTGTHKILDASNEWIDVSNYNNKILVENFRDPYVYCIGTNSKLIKINDLIFSDWDEVDDDMIEKLCGDTMSRFDIHKHYEVGLHPDTVIQLVCGKHIKIKDVEVNDRLICGAIVETVIKVKTADINDFCEITYNTGLIILAAKNTEFIVGDDMTFETRTAPPPDFCYHIVTDCGGFKLSDVFVSDYNRGIDKFFE